MASALNGGIERVLRAAVASGRFDEIGGLLAANATLDTSNETGRGRVQGRKAIVAHLSNPGPGEVLHWDAHEWPSGLAVTFEWRGSSGVDRRRWYVRAEGGQIAGMWSYAARPSEESARELPDAVFASVAGGAGARHAALEHAGNSGASLERVTLTDGTQLIAKYVGRAADWLGRVTGDQGRTPLLWQAGAFARLPPTLDHGIEGVVADGDGWWVLMRDLSASFLGNERRLSRAESRRILGAGAGLHAEFAGDVPDGAAALGDRLGMSSRRVAEAERRGSDLLPKQLEAAWDAFAESVPPDVGTEVMAAVDDVTPLVTALEAAGPVTLLHGDLRDDNLGLTEEAVVLLDWDLATAGTPTVEFAWYLCHDAWRIDAGHDEIEADFRAAEGEALSEREVELGMLTGLVQYGWILGHSLQVHPDPAEQEWARIELGWWVQRSRRALELTGGMPR
jgi:Phosphotransferase enzyme family